MTKNNDSGKFSTLVAIDIALRRNEVLIQRPGRKRYRMSMTNDRADHDRLVRHLQNIGGDSAGSAKARSTIAEALSGGILFHARCGRGGRSANAFTPTSA